MSEKTRNSVSLGPSPFEYSVPPILFKDFSEEEINKIKDL